MKIFLVDAIDPIDIDVGIDGRRRYVMDLISKLADRGVETTLVGGSRGKKRAREVDFNFIPILKSKKITGYKFLIYLLIKLPFLKLPENSIIHAQRPDQMLPFTLSHRKIKKVCTLHGIDYNAIYLKKGKFIGTIYRMVEKFVLNRTDKIIVTNESTKKFYSEKYPKLRDKLILLPVGIDTKKFKPLDKLKMRERYEFGSKDKIIMFVGRLEKEKNLEFLLRVFKIIKREVENAKLVLVGGGRERENLEILAKQFGLDDVMFMGMISHDKVPEILSCADVFALCSLYESGPLVIQEALACGIPSVATDVGRVKEFIVSNFTGRITGRDENDFASAIISVLNMDSEGVKERCRKIASDFSFEKTADRTIKIYEKLLKSEI